MRVTIYYKGIKGWRHKETINARSIIDNGDNIGFGLIDRSFHCSKQHIKKVKVKF